MKKCRKDINDSSLIISPVATQMLRKLNSCKELVCSPLVNVARVVNPRFGSNNIPDSDTQWPFASLLDLFISVSNSILPPKKSRSVFDLVLEYNSMENLSEEYISSFLKSTSLSEHTIDIIISWRPN